jgi:hypothetical protein
MPLLGVPAGNSAKAPPMSVHVQRKTHALDL